MSSYLVNSSTALAVAAAIIDDPKCEKESTFELASEVLYINALAVADRYNEEPKFTELDRSQAREFTDIEMFGCIRCWRYQVNVSDDFAGRAPVVYSYEAEEEIAQRNEWEYNEYFEHICDSWGNKVDYPWGVDDIERKPEPKPSKFAAKKRIPTKLRAIQSQVKAMQA